MPWPLWIVRFFHILDPVHHLAILIAVLYIDPFATDPPFRKGEQRRSGPGRRHCLADLLLHRRPMQIQVMVAFDDGNMSPRRTQPDKSP